MTKQLKDLKDQLKRQYPQVWKDKYFDLPEMPSQENIRKKVDQNIFVIFENKLNK
jgi:hypothetical protein